MEIASFLKLLSQPDGFGCGIFVFGCFSQFFNVVFLCCLLVLGLKFLFFKGTSLFVQYLEKIYRISPKIYRISPKIECCNSFDREHKDFNNNNGNNGFVSKSNLVDGLDQKKPIILHWSTDSADELSLSKKKNKSRENCDHLLLRDGIDLSKNSDITVAFDEKNNHGEEDESEGEESRSRSDEDQVFDVITLRKMVKKERKRGDRMKLELEKERRAAKSAAEEAMAMLLKLRMEKSVEMEAKQYKRVAEQKQVYDQQVIQSLQWLLMKLMKLDDEEKIQD